MKFWGDVCLSVDHHYTEMAVKALVTGSILYFLSVRSQISRGRVKQLISNLPCHGIYTMDLVLTDLVKASTCNFTGNRGSQECEGGQVVEV